MRLHSHQVTQRLGRIGGWKAGPPLGLNFTAEDAAGLQSSILGTVVLPTDPDYPQSRESFIATFQEFPQIIVYCESMGDVRSAILFANKFELTITCRSGGHNTAGFAVCPGMVLDVSRISHVIVDPDTKRAQVGAGTYFEKLYAVLDLYGLHAPGAGGCYNVGVGGFVQGGGYGFTSLMYGISSDNIVEMLVVLADGTIVVASEEINAPLFWALRGGTGNNFGVVVQVTYALRELPELWGFGLKWPLESAPAALALMQRDFTRGVVPENLGYQCLMEFVDGKPCLLMRGVYLGTPEQGKSVLAPLSGTADAELELSLVSNFSHLNSYLLQEGTEATPMSRVRSIVDSRYVSRDLSESEWGRVVDCFLATPTQTNLIGLEPYGGRTNAVSPQMSAFVHRAVSMDVYSWSLWQDGQDPAPAHDFLDKLMDLVGGFGDGAAYQNYSRRSNSDYRSMYWGENFDQLLAIKKHYDPDGVFHHGQPVSPPPPGVQQPPAGPIVFPKLPPVDRRGAPTLPYGNDPR